MATGMATAGPSPGVGLFGARFKTKAWVVSLVDQTYSLTDPVTSRTFPVNEPWLRQPQLLFSGGFVAAGLGGEQDSHLYFTPMP
jgi:hypothetical protein